MDRSKEDLINLITTGGLLAVFSALVKAILSNDPMPKKIRGFLAGSILGTIIFFVLRNVNLSEASKEILCICFASFSTTIYPVMEKKFTNWLKKSADVLPNSDID